LRIVTVMDYEGIRRTPNCFFKMHVVFIFEDDHCKEKNQGPNGKDDIFERENHLSIKLNYTERLENPSHCI
jgi:hypothetical protein